jgi:hypothetical protein
MNDEELIMAVRAQRDKVPMNTPVEQIISRGRAVRTRRWVRRVAGTLAVTAAAVAVAVTTLVPSGHPAQLAAWTVTKQADGKIHITIRELRDPAGLQRTLRAEGVPAVVSYSYATRLCQSDWVPEPQALFDTIAQVHADKTTESIVIDPSAIPRGLKLAIGDDILLPDHPKGGPPGIGIGFVNSTAQCGPLVVPVSPKPSKP